MYRYCFYDLKVHFWWLIRVFLSRISSLNTLHCRIGPIEFFQDSTEKNFSFANLILSSIMRKVWYHQIWIQNNFGFMMSDLVYKQSCFKSQNSWIAPHKSVGTSLSGPNCCWTVLYSSIFFRLAFWCVVRLDASLWSEFPNFVQKLWCIF